MEIDLVAQLSDQLDWHWRRQLRPRLKGLTDEEYFWEPSPECWSIRLRGQSGTPNAAGTGTFAMDLTLPEPIPPPVTTIAWRMAHLIVGALGSRVAAHFGGPPVGFNDFEYAGTAEVALAQLDEHYAAWIGGVRKLGPDGLARPCGPAEGPFAEYPMAALILHINREIIHHGAEIALLRDLYAHRADYG